MQESVAVFLLIGLFAVMIICHLPVTFAMVIATATTMLYLNIPMMTMVQQMAKSVNSFSLLAIPFFILMGEIMGAGGISDRLLKFANVLVGRFRGGSSLCERACFHVLWRHFRFCGCRRFLSGQDRDPHDGGCRIR